MKNNGKFLIPSHLYLATVQIKNRRQITNRANLRRFSNFLTHAIGMKKTRNVIVDALPSEIFGVNSYSVNQPLKTSVQSTDTWPEKLDDGALVILIHSCVELDEERASTAILHFFKGSKIVKQSRLNHTYDGEATNANE